MRSIYLAKKESQGGYTLVELLVTIAIFALVFGGLMASVQMTLQIISRTKSSTGALALANERIEYIRSLPYASVGTVSGIPSGAIPQNSTSSLNGVVYNERVLIEYIDSPDDGFGASDVNGIVADYKEIKVEYSWFDSNGTSSIFLLTDVVPPGIESTTGGGTLTVNVFDATVQPVSGADVRLYNNTTTTTIDTTRHTNAAGVAMFSGAPAAANYQITVTETGYSTDQTYSATTSNPNPNPPHVAVLQSAVSTMNFQIDLLSDLTVRTIGPASNGTFTDTFSDMTKVATSTNVAISSDSLVLSGAPGSYAASGLVFGTSTTPAVITSWSTADWNATTAASTTITFHVYRVTGTSTYSLVSDSDLSGNGVGFTNGPINLSGLSVVTYPTLALGAMLTSSNSNVTPSLQDWQINYVISEPIIGSIPFTIRGNKTIGTTAAAAPVYKYSQSYTTNGFSGSVQIQNLEFDTYDVSLNSGVYDIKGACPSIPLTITPNTSNTLTLTLVPSVSRSIRVNVVDVSGNPIVGANVDLSRSAFSDSGVASVCGQVFFNSGLSIASDYQVTVEAVGYTDQTISNINIDGTETLKVILSAS